MKLRTFILLAPPLLRFLVSITAHENNGSLTTSCLKSPQELWVMIVPIVSNQSNSSQKNGKWHDNESYSILRTCVLRVFREPMLYWLLRWRL